MQWRWELPCGAGPAVLPFAACEVTIEDDDDTKDVACFSSEFFAPVFVVARLSVDWALDTDAQATLKRMCDSGDVSAGGAEGAAALRALASAFLKSAVPFANDVLWGNLVTVLQVDADTQASLPEEVQEAVDALEYGSVVVNHGAGQAYFQTVGTWGGFQGPDTSVADARSGVGLINNMLLYDHPQKSVVWFDWDAKAPLMPEKGVPAWLAKPMAGAMSGGLGGLWTALRPGRH